MAYPDSALLEDEEVLVHAHPSWSTVFWPVTGFPLVVGVASFAAAAVPPGAAQRDLRLAVLGAAVVLVLLLVVRPVLRWGTTHRVVTTHRVLHRAGVLARRHREVALDQVTQVTLEQSPWQRVTRSGAVTVGTAGAAALVLLDVARARAVATLVQQLADDLAGEALAEDRWPGDPSPWPGTAQWDGTVQWGDTVQWDGTAQWGDAGVR